MPTPPMPPASTRFWARLALLSIPASSAASSQYPWGFKPNEVNIDRLRDLRDRMGDIPTVVEFRNSDWVNDQTFELLRELDLGFCCVDEPHLKGLMPGVAAVTSGTGYIRFHGRNAKNWWNHEESYQRYDYLYSEEELQEWVPKAEEVIERARDTYMFFNNHYKGKSAINARTFARMLGPAPAAGNYLRSQTDDPRG